MSGFSGIASPPGVTGATGAGTLNNIDRTMDANGGSQHLTLQDAINFFKNSICGVGCTITIIGLVGGKIQEDLDFSLISGHLTIQTAPGLSFVSDGLCYSKGQPIIGNIAGSGSGKVIDIVGSGGNLTTITTDGVAPDFETMVNNKVDQSIQALFSSQDFTVASYSTNTITGGNGSNRTFLIFKPKVMIERLTNNGNFFNLTRRDQHVSLKNILLKSELAAVGILRLKGDSLLDFTNCHLRVGGAFEGQHVTAHIDATGATIQFLGNSNCISNGGFKKGGLWICEDGMVFTRPFITDTIGMIFRGKNVNCGPATSGTSGNLAARNSNFQLEDSNFLDYELEFQGCDLDFENVEHLGDLESRPITIDSSKGTISNSKFSDNPAGTNRFHIKGGSIISGEGNDVQDNLAGNAIRQEEGSTLAWSGTTLSGNNANTSTDGTGFLST